MTQAGEYIQLFIQSIEVFEHTPTFRPFNIGVVVVNNPVCPILFKTIIIFLISASGDSFRYCCIEICILIREKYQYYKCSDPAFLQALISITQQINPKVEFQANKDSLLIIPFVRFYLKQ